MPSLKSRVKQEVLARAMGQCERCDRELGSRFYFHYKGYRVLHPDAVIVVCSKCHSEIQSRRGKIY